ncbi:MAG TPA: hypothetical protein VN632_11435 [Stellaceae bacterium]|nr:hypothetical protein [Stellaceae bacterium]
MSMHFLGVYNLAAVLAIAGAVGVCTYSSHAAADGYDDYDAANYALPPAGSIINRPPTRIDNGYNPNFYWNRVALGDYADNDAGDDGDSDGAYGYQPRYPQTAYAADPGDNYLGYGAYAGGGYAYYGYAGDYGSYDGRRVVVTRHERRREAMNRVHHEAPAHDIHRDGGAYTTHVQPAEHRGFNGHDAHMFDADRRPAKPADAGYEVHGGSGQNRHDRQHQ